VSALPFGHFVPRERTASADQVEACMAHTEEIHLFLYGCETWSLTLREEHWPRVLENRVLRGIFVSKRDGVTGGWRRLHNEELYDLYWSQNVIRFVKSR
jgi:hypothetical protein